MYLPVTYTYYIYLTSFYSLLNWTHIILIIYKFFLCLPTGLSSKIGFLYSFRIKSDLWKPINYNYHNYRFRYQLRWEILIWLKTKPPILFNPYFGQAGRRNWFKAILRVFLFFFNFCGSIPNTLAYNSNSSR